MRLRGLPVKFTVKVLVLVLAIGSGKFTLHLKFTILEGTSATLAVVNIRCFSICNLVQMLNWSGDFFMTEICVVLFKTIVLHKYFIHYYTLCVKQVRQTFI